MRQIRATGIATEVYYKILDNLRNNCNGLGGFFVEYQYAQKYGYNPDNFCRIDSDNVDSVFYINPIATTPRSLTYWYHFVPKENICPANYTSDVDTQSWGMCSCWENGGRRSKNGLIGTCRPVLPTTTNEPYKDDIICSANLLCKKSYEDGEYVPDLCSGSRSLSYIPNWCQQTITSSLGQVCPMIFVTGSGQSLRCSDENESEIQTVSSGVPYHLLGQ